MKHMIGNYAVTGSNWITEKKFSLLMSDDDNNSSRKMLETTTTTENTGKVKKSIVISHQY